MQILVEFAIEMRRRVKEQLKRIGGMEFWDTNFSYIDKETQEEHYVGLPEEKGSNLIENTPLQPGVCYTSTSDGDNVVLVRVEVVTIAEKSLSSHATVQLQFRVKLSCSLIISLKQT